MAVIEEYTEEVEQVQVPEETGKGVGEKNSSEVEQVQLPDESGKDVEKENSSAVGLVESVTSLTLAAKIEADADSEEEDDGDGIEAGGRGGLKGFLSKPEQPWKISRLYFPCKAGGAPAWLDPTKVPSAKQGSCGICDNPLQFVLQVYAPVDDYPAAFHRTLFVFMCTSLACLEQDQSQQRRKDRGRRSVKVFRNQLPRLNDYYPGCPPKPDGTETPLCKGAALCSWCGTWKGDKLCGGCKKTRYCSQSHQLTHWRGDHAAVCREEQERLKSTELNSSGPSSTAVEGTESTAPGHPASPSLWPEFELTVDDSVDDEDESDEEPAADSQSAWRRLISDYEGRRRRGGDEFTEKDVQEIEESSPEEQHWAGFQARVSKTPEQVLWYKRSADAKPLWPRLNGQAKASDIPDCPHCSGKRTFEFQILPQLLYFFQLKDDPDSLDWGTIAVYSCENSCDVEGYSEEFAWVQPGFS